MIWKLTCIALITAGTYVLLKKEKPEFAFLAEAGGVALAVLCLFPSLQSAVRTMEEYFSAAGIDALYIKILLQSLGIAVLTKLTADICRDAGQTAMATKTELGGKILITVLALPLLQEIFSLIKGLLTMQ